MVAEHSDVELEVVATVATITVHLGCINIHYLNNGMHDLIFSSLNYSGTLATSLRCFTNLNYQGTLKPRLVVICNVR